MIKIVELALACEITDFCMPIVPPKISFHSGINVGGYDCLPVDYLEQEATLYLVKQAFSFALEYFPFLTKPLVHGLTPLAISHIEVGRVQAGDGMVCASSPSLPGHIQLAIPLNESYLFRISSLISSGLIPRRLRRKMVG